MPTSSGNREKAMSILKMARITQAPIDVDTVAKALGFKVVPFDFPNQRKGMVVIEQGIKAIGVNKNHPKSLQRYTVAHELGHYLNGHSHYENELIDDETRFHDHHFQQEREADLFAAELLMPKDFLEKDLAEIGLDIQKLLEKYQVSEQAMWIRLTSLNLAEKYASHSKTTSPKT